MASFTPPFYAGHALGLVRLVFGLALSLALSLVLLASPGWAQPAAWLTPTPQIGQTQSPIHFPSTRPTHVPTATESSVWAADFPWGSVAGKVVYVDFWASWCGPCRQSFPWMNAMQARYGQEGLEIIAVNVDQDLAKAQAFLAQYPAQFKVRYDPKGQLAKAFALKSMPTSFLYDRQGRLLATHAGFHLSERAAYEGELKKALALPN